MADASAPRRSTAAHWIRLEARVGGAPAAADDVAALGDRLRNVFGCRALWWLPDAHAAWTAVLSAFASAPGHRVLVPAGIDAHIESAAVACGTTLVELDLESRSAAPRWDAGAASSLEGPAVLVIDHRFGVPWLPPLAAPHDLAVIEDAAAAAGGMASGRPVGAVGTAAVVELGEPPFARSRGALVITASAGAQERVASRLGSPSCPGSPINMPDDVRAHLAADIRDLPDWVDGCRAAAGVYDSAWRSRGLPLETIETPGGSTSTASQYIVLVPDPDGLVQALDREGIEARRPWNARLERRLREPMVGGLAGARLFYGRAVRLPNHPRLELGEILYVADVVRRHLEAARA